MAHYEVIATDKPFTAEDFGKRAQFREGFWERNFSDAGTSSKTVTIQNWRMHVPEGTTHLIMRWVTEDDIAEALQSGFFKTHSEFLIGFPVIKKERA